jgi:hypothetical protein
MIKMYTSLVASIVVQLVTGVIELLSLFLKVPPKLLFIKQMMMLELAVQMIEGSFYLYWFFHFTKITNITPSRYADWVLTTPTMLINLIFYLIYLQSDTNLNFLEVWNQEWKTIVPILCLNWLMLLFGYLGEIALLPIKLSVTAGFIPFLMYFYMIYINYVKDNTALFYYFFIFWALYGVAAMLSYKMKNNGYNILDLFAKNFFGIFLTYLLIKK